MLSAFPEYTNFGYVISITQTVKNIPQNAELQQILNMAVYIGGI